MLPDYAALPEALRDGTRRDAAAIDAVYFHIPFCSTKCHYCDFYSIAGHLDQADAYLAALERELILQGEFFGRPRPRTIFVGGGTPTLLEPRQLERFFSLVRRHIDLSALCEFTVEANPNTFTAEKAAVLAAAGVNRISCGAQSFNRAELSTLQRDHDPASVAPAFEFARRAGIDNLSLDLIFGIPGQTLASWEFSLANALALAPAHISCYSLTYEPNTAMTARLKRGEFAAMDEEMELELFNHVHARLRAAGFARYEITNYGRMDSPDLREGAAGGVRACAHNLAYWKSRNWLAFGPSGGAHVALPQLQEPMRRTLAVEKCRQPHALSGSAAARCAPAAGHADGNTHAAAMGGGGGDLLAAAVRRAEFCGISATYRRGRARSAVRRAGILCGIAVARADG